MALELVNPAPKKHLAFAGAIKHLWAKMTAMHGPGQVVFAWATLAKLSPHSPGEAGQEPQVPPEAYLHVKPPCTLAGKAGFGRLSDKRWVPLRPCF